MAHLQQKGIMSSMNPPKPDRDTDLAVPINLKKATLPAVTIYGDAEGKDLAKILWGLVAGQDIRFLTPDTEEELLNEAYHSALIFIKISSMDDYKISLATKLYNMRGVVADVIAITEEPEIRNRLHVMSQDFDGIYNREILELPEFRRVLLHKIKKGSRRLEARIQEDEYHTFKAYLSSSADAFIVFDNYKRIFFVSDHYKIVYPKSVEFFVRGVPVQRAFESVAREMNLVPSDPRYDAVKDFWVGMRGSYEFTLDNGKVLRMVATSLPEGQGTIISTTDITTYKRQEERLEQQQAEVQDALNKEQEASQMQKQFIAMVSHEFRTPLTIVDGNAQLIERRIETIGKLEIVKRTKTIRSAVSRLVNMMEAVLSSNLLRTGKLDLNLEDFDVRELIEDLCNEHRDLSKDHVIISDLSMMPETVHMDRKIMTIILTNLLSNAVKYSVTNPQILIEGGVNDGALTIRIQDNGVGIPENELPHIFERFYRATTSSGIVGSGVGLSLVADLVSLHNGTIRVDSVVGKGSVFTLEFKVKE